MYCLNDSKRLGDDPVVCSHVSSIYNSDTHILAASGIGASVSVIGDVMVLCRT